MSLKEETEALLLKYKKLNEKIENVGREIAQKIKSALQLKDVDVNKVILLSRKIPLILPEVVQVQKKEKIECELLYTKIIIIVSKEEKEIKKFLEDHSLEELVELVPTAKECESQ